MECRLNETLTKEFTNDNGITRIIPRWDEDAVRACPDCGGFKHIEQTDDLGYRRVRPCPGSYTLRRIELYNQAQVPARFMDADFEHFDYGRLQEDSSIRGFCRCIREFKKGASGRLLEGGPGTGKTHLLCAAIRYLTLELGIPCRYVDYSNLLSDIRAAYSLNIPESNAIDPIAKVPVLFLDELGKGRDKKNDFELRIIDEIINRRYSNPDLTTFFASNYLDRDSSGYNNYMNGGYGTSQWPKYAAKRYRAEHFASVESFMAYVDKLMQREHIEDRISERTASRILAMAAPTVVNAPDYRRNPGK